MAHSGHEAPDARQDEEKLLEMFAQLAPSGQETLIAFAEFLVARGPGMAELPDPQPRPAGESVAMAIRRLVRGYPMLDRRRLIGETSRYMAQHAIEGRPAAEVIDELEGVFARHYQQSQKAEGRRQKEKP
jgi:hypothetical protein